MRNIKKIFIVVFSLILLFAVSCSNDDKTGVNNNPPENDTEITDGETGGSGTGGSGTETGGGTGTGGDSGSETGGSGSGSSSGEGEGGTETPPSETETIEEIDAKDFPEDLKGLYAHSKVETDIRVSDDKGQTRIIAKLIPEDGSDGITVHTIRIKKWTKTTKGGKIIKIECEDNENGYIITFDYENKTISGAYIINNKKYASFSGTKK